MPQLKPKVSVVMAVYNDEKYLHEAIESILNQMWKDFEFIIINDGSQDSTQKIIDSYKDPRLVILRNDNNLGLTRSLNAGLRVVRGEYIARMDADDISLAERLERQVTFLDENPSVGLVGTAFVYMDESGNEKKITRPKTERSELKSALFRENQFAHGSLLFRRICFDTVGLYREEFKYAQDYDFCLRIAEKFEIACLEEVLYKYRVSLKSISVVNLSKQNAYHAYAKECAQRRKTGIPENYESIKMIEGIKEYQIGFIKRLRSQKIIADYHMIWGKDMLKNLKVSDSRCEFCRAIKSFPLYVTAWFYWMSSFLGYRLLRKILPVALHLNRSVRSCW